MTLVSNVPFRPVAEALDFEPRTVLSTTAEKDPAAIMHYFGKWFVKALKELWLKALWLKVLWLKALWRKVLGRKKLWRKVLWRKALWWKVLWGGITSTSNEGPVPTASWRPFKGSEGVIQPEK